MLARDTFYNLPRVQLRSLAGLQTLHINSKLRQQQWQTHYTGKKEKVFKKSLPSFHFCLRKHCGTVHAMFPLPHQGHIQPPRSVLHTKAKGRWGQCLGCKIARMERSLNGIFSSSVGKTHRHGAPVAEMCASGQDKLKALVLQ